MSGLTPKERFLKLCKTHIKREGIENLIDWLERSDFFTAPASTRFHGSYDGGLCEHSLNVYDCLEKLISIHPEIEASEETIAICALWHDICKIGFYKPEWKNQKIYSSAGSKYDEGGRFDWHTVKGYSIDDSLPYGHGEKSVYIINGFIRLTRDEALAIRWHMGGFDEAVRGGSYAMSGAYEKCPLAVLLHIADLEATYLCGENNKELCATSPVLSRQ